MSMLPRSMRWRRRTNDFNDCARPVRLFSVTAIPRYSGFCSDRPLERSTLRCVSASTCFRFRESIVMGESIHPFSAAEERPAAQRLGQVPFHAHVELLQLFLAHRDEIVERIQGLLNAQRKPTQYLQDGPPLSRHFEDCFFTLTGVTSDQSRLRGQLDQAHWASGFRPRKSPGLHNDLVDPAEMTVRAFYLWRQTHWPGHNGRVRYAHTLFNLYLIRCLALLSMRLWDAGSTSAPKRVEDRVEDRAEDRLSQVKAFSTTYGESHRLISRCSCGMRDG